MTIKGAYIWDDVTIGDGSMIRRTVVAHGVVVGRGCTVEPGSLLSFGVRIADKMTIKGTSRISKAKRKRGDDESLETVTTDIQIVGEDGEGYEFHGSDSEDEDAEDKDSRGLSKTYLPPHVLIRLT